MPLSLETPRLVWRALAAAGLDRGKINSYHRLFFEPGVPGHQHLVEGRTASGIFRDNARVVVELLAENGGTRLNVDTVRTDRATDLGFRLRGLKRHYSQEIEQFLLTVAVESDDEVEVPLPPPASPDGRDERVRFVEAQTGVILPTHISSPNILRLLLSGWRENWKASLAYFVLWGVALWSADRFDLWGPFFLALAMMDVWTWKKYRMGFQWFNFLFFGGLGVWRTFVLLQRWI